MSHSTATVTHRELVPRSLLILPDEFQSPDPRQVALDIATYGLPPIVAIASEHGYLVAKDFAHVLLGVELLVKWQNPVLDPLNPKQILNADKAYQLIPVDVYPFPFF